MGTVADWMVRTLIQQGAQYAFLVPGYLIGPLVEALASIPGCRPVVAAHELGAAFMADGFARASGHLACCMSIAGPGASNMLTAAVTARIDRIPLLCLVGDVPSSGAGRGGFQDGGERGMRDRALFAQAVPYAAQCCTAAAAAAGLHDALRAMRGIPPGPAFLSMPRDLLASEQDAAPLALVGAASAPACVRDLRRFAEAYSVPVATTLPAKGVFPESHPLSLGAFGYGGTPRARAALLESDLHGLIVVGAELNERNTMHWDPRLFAARHIVRIMPWQTAEVDSGVEEFTGDCALALDR
jgi:acetolactate synthase-1/2/3 large subunit